MNGYDYLNARVRGMSADLLSKEFFERILETEGMNAAVDALFDTAYAPRLHEALAVGRGIGAVESALRRNLYSAFERVREIAPPDPRRLLYVQFGRWDAANILAVIRGLSTGADVPSIVAGTLPAGELDEPRLAELASAPTIRAVTDTLVTWNSPFAFELRDAVRPYAAPPDPVALESAVNAVYFSHSFSALGGADPNARIVLGTLRLQADLANVRIALDYVRHASRGEELADFIPIEGGTIGVPTVQKIARAVDMVDAFEVLEGTVFAPGIERGILAFGGAGSLGIMERFLEMVVEREGCRLFRKDPLSIAVPLGFVWKKYVEFVNLRVLLRGKAYGVPVNTIREELLLE